VIADGVALQDALGAMRDAHLQAARLEALRSPTADSLIRRAALSRMIAALERLQGEQLKAYRRLCPRLTTKKARRRAKHLLGQG